MVKHSSRSSEFRVSVQREPDGYPREWPIGCVEPKAAYTAYAGAEIPSAERSKPARAFHRH